MKKIIRSFPPVVAFFFALTLSIASVGLLFLAGLFVGSVLFDTSVMGLLSKISQAGEVYDVNILRYILALQTLAFFVVPPLVFSFVYGLSFLSTFSLQSRPRGELLGYTIVVVVVAFPFINFLSDFNGQIIDGLLGVGNSLKARELEAETIIRTLGEDSSVMGVLLNIIVMAMLPALCEELFFRGMMQSFFFKGFKNIHLAILLTGVVFSFIHFQFYGFLPRMLLGIFFGYLLAWGGSLWVPIVAHFLNNLMAVVGLMLISKGILPPDIDKIGTSDSMIYLGMVSALVVCFLVFRLFEKYPVRNYKPVFV